MGIIVETGFCANSILSLVANFGLNLLQFVSFFTLVVRLVVLLCLVISDALVTSGLLVCNFTNSGCGGCW